MPHRAFEGFTSIIVPIVKIPVANKRHGSIRGAGQFGRSFANENGFELRDYSINYQRMPSLSKFRTFLPLVLP